MQKKSGLQARFLIVFLMAILSGCKRNLASEAIGFSGSESIWQAGRLAKARGLAYDALEPPLGKLWIRSFGENVPGDFSVSRDLALIGDSSGRVYALNDSDGSEVWRFDANSPVELAPAFTDEHAIVAAGASLFSLRLDPGAPERLSAVFLDKGKIGFPAILAGGLILAGGEGGKLNALSLKLEQTPLWSADVPEGIVAPPATWQNWVFAVSETGRLLQRNENWGAQTKVYSRQIPGPVYAPPLIFEGRLVVCLWNGVVLAFDVGKDGVEGEGPAWIQKASGQVKDAVAQTQDKLIVGDYSGQLMALNSQDGSILWKRRLDGRLEAGLAISGGLAYVGDTSGRIWALNAESGEIVWRRDWGSPIRKGPAIANNALYFTDGDNNLVAFAALADKDSGASNKKGL